MVLELSVLSNRSRIMAALLNDTESFSASRISVNRSLGKALDTLSLCRQEMAVEPNLAL